MHTRLLLTVSIFSLLAMASYLVVFAPESAADILASLAKLVTALGALAAALATLHKVLERTGRGTGSKR